MWVPGTLTLRVSPPHCTASLMLGEVRFFWTAVPRDGEEEKKHLSLNYMWAGGRQGTDPSLCPRPWPRLLAPRHSLRGQGRGRDD